MENNILSKMNHKKLEHEGHLYVFAKLSADGFIKFWRCENKNNKDMKCRGRLHTNLNDVVLKQVNEHVCGANPARVEAQRVVTGIKRRAIETAEPPSTLRSIALQNVGTPVLSEVPTKNATKQLIKRARNEGITPAMPLNLNQLQIPPQYQIYARNENETENFLLADSGTFLLNENGPPQRILIFGRMSHNSWANQMTECYADGTFSLSPPLFSQVFAVLARRGKWVFPVFYALLTSKTSAIYQRMFSMIKAVWPAFSPQSMSLDFEIGLMNAVREEFPNCNLRCCFFHLVRNFKKKMAEQNVIQRYNHDSNFAEMARCITSLAFVPLGTLTQAIVALDHHIPAELDPVFDWFMTNYTGRVRPNGTRTQPLFDPGCWNLHERTVHEQDRTNNFAEAAHRRLQRAFTCHHPSVWRFIDTIRQEQKKIDADYALFVAGHDPPPKCKKYREADERILRLTQNFNPLNIMEFLIGVSRNYQMDA